MRALSCSVELGGSVIVDDGLSQMSGANPVQASSDFPGGETETVGDDTVNCGVEHADKPISNAATRAERFDMLLNLCELAPHMRDHCGLGCRFLLGGLEGDGSRRYCSDCAAAAAST